MADRAHHRSRFSGRDPEEGHRASTPLELLYDLTIVVAFGTAADELAHYVAEGHYGAGVARFAFRRFRGQLGVVELHLVRLGLRHRRPEAVAVNRPKSVAACWDGVV